MNQSIQKLKCLLVDDEPHARSVLRNLISNVSQLEIAGECSNAFEAFSALQVQKIDLVFLDVQMPQLSGIDFLRSLAQPPKVVFITAYADYAVEGFELDAVDYLLKPVSLERFMKCVGKVLREFSVHMAPAVQNTNDEEKPFIFVRSDRKMVKIRTEDIQYVESLRDYVHFHLSDGEQIVSKQTLQAVEEILSEDQFLRIHRSYIINKEAVRAFDNSEVMLKNESLPIGRYYKKEVISQLESNTAKS